MKLANVYDHATEIPLNATMSESESSKVVDRLLDGFNSHDVEAVLSLCADDPEVFAFPSTLLARGATAIRDHLAEYFRVPNLKVQQTSTLVSGQTVVALLRMTRAYPEGLGWNGFGTIYEVHDEKISRMWIIPSGWKIDHELALPEFHRQNRSS